MQNLRSFPTNNLQATSRKVSSAQDFSSTSSSPIRETKVFIDAKSKKVVVSFRGLGTDFCDFWRFWKDIRSDWNIFKGSEDRDPRFKSALKECEKIRQKYSHLNDSFDMTGHSPGGQLATYMNKKKRGKVDKNLSFTRGTGLFEPFRKRPQNTHDYSHAHDLISQGARLSRDESGGKHHSHVSHMHVNKKSLKAYNIDSLGLPIRNYKQDANPNFDPNMYSRENFERKKNRHLERKVATQYYSGFFSGIGCQQWSSKFFSKGIQRKVD